MIAVWKYPVLNTGPDGSFEHQIPVGSRFLDCQIQHGAPVMWWLVFDGAEKRVRRFRVVGTGHAIDRPEALTHLATFQLYGGDIVLHLFEELTQ